MGDRADHTRDDETTALPDLSGRPLDEVLSDGDTALDHAVRRLVRDLSRPGEHYAAHGNTLDT